MLNLSLNRTLYSISTKSKKERFTTMNEASMSMFQPEMIFQQVPVISRKCREKMDKGAVYNLKEAKEIFDGVFYDDDC